MSSSWRIAGTDLDTATVKVVVKPLTMKADQQVRLQQSARLHALARRHVLGRDLPLYAFRLEFLGPDQDRTTRCNYVRSLLRTNDTWLLEAPDAPNEVYFNNAVKSLGLTAISMGLVYAEGVGVIALDIVAMEPAPEDQAQANNIGLTTGVSILFNGYCQTIVEEVVRADTIAKSDAVAVTDGFALATTVVVSDAAGATENVLFADSVLIDNSPALTEQRLIQNP